MELLQIASIKKTPLQQIFEPIFEQHNVKVFIKRDDLLHPVISGNKWYKLKYNLDQAIGENYKTLISFGGAYSNHLHALAFAGKQAGIQTVGIVRGELCEPLNDTLQFATDHGMTLHYVDRVTYRKKMQPSFLESLVEMYGRSYIIPEGGCNRLAVKGCREIVYSIDEPFDVICCACGTGGTLAGLIAGLKGCQRALGVSVLKGAGFQVNDIKVLLGEWSVAPGVRWDINNEYHFGGYAKVSEKLKHFVLAFEEKHEIPIEPVYTGKMLYGLYELIRSGYFKCGETIVALHSGGLQGRDSALSTC